MSHQKRTGGRLRRWVFSACVYGSVIAAGADEQFSFYSSGGFTPYFVDGQTVALAFRGQENVPGKDAVSIYRISDVFGNVVSEGTFAMSPSKSGGSWGRLTIELPPAQRKGWFRCSVYDSSNSVAAKIEQDFAVIPKPLESPVRDSQTYFGFSDIGGGTGAAPIPGPEAFRMMKDLGAGWFRFFMWWGNMQPTPDSPIDWSRMDSIVESAARFGIKVLPGLVRTPSAEFAEFAPGDDPASQSNQDMTNRRPKAELWETFVRQAVARYAGRVDCWEVWNEPNAKSWWYKGDADEYADFISVTHNIIKDENPAARVVMGGLSGVKTKWVKRILDVGAGPAIDVANIHPYRFPDAPPETGNPDGAEGYGQLPILQDLSEFKAQMNRLADTKPDMPLWVTEGGYNTMLHDKRPLHQGISEEEQAQLLIRTMVLARAGGVDRFFWWRLYDTFGAYLGIIRNQDFGFAPKPALVAYAVLERVMGPAPQVTVMNHPTDGDVYGCRIEGPNGSVLAAWTLEKTVYEKFPIKDGECIRYVDAMGNSHEVAAVNGVCDVEIGPWPIYLKTDNWPATIEP